MVRDVTPRRQPVDGVPQRARGQEPGHPASYTGGTGTSTLTFSYTVGAGQISADLAVTAFNLVGATLRDAATNDASTGGAVTNPTGTLIIDTTAPTVAKTGYNNGSKKVTGTYSDSGSGVATVNVSDTSGTTSSGNASLSSGTWTYINAASLANNDNLTIIATDIAGNQTTLNTTAPAGVAGSPINRALSNPADHVGAISLTIAGVPSGWTLSEGTDNGDGSWTVQTNDPSALTVTTAADFTGAMVLNVTQSWTNTDGTTVSATIADNVEVFAPG